MRVKVLCASLFMLLLSSSSLLAQQGPPGGPGGGPGGPGGGPPDFTKIRQQMSDRMKTVLGASDDEWKVLEPKVEKVFELQMDTSGRMLSMSLLMGFDMNSFMTAPDAKPSAVQTAGSDLFNAFNNTSTSPSELKVKITAFVAAKSKAKIELVQAQQDLLAVLTSRQEATLVMMGMLE